MLDTYSLLGLIEEYEGRHDKMYKNKHGELMIGIGYKLENSTIPDTIIDGLLRSSILYSANYMIDAIGIDRWAELTDYQRNVLLYLGVKFSEEEFLKHSKFIIAIKENKIELASTYLKHFNFDTKSADRLPKLIELMTNV